VLLLCFIWSTEQHRLQKCIKLSQCWQSVGNYNNTNQPPPHLCVLVTTVVGRRHLRSADSRCLVPRTKTVLGNFAVIGPLVWNSWTANVHSADFCQKTDIFVWTARMQLTTVYSAIKNGPIIIILIIIFSARENLPPVSSTLLLISSDDR